MYTHLSRDQRVSLATLLREGYAQKDIAAVLRVHPSTIGRELHRNSDGRYHATHAHVLARRRRNHAKLLYRLLEHNKQYADTVEALLCPLISPKVIGYLLGILHQTIYSWIYRSRPDLRAGLPYQGKKRRKYGQKREKYTGWTKKVKRIDTRPPMTISWEGDTVKGDTRAQLLTHVERTSLYTRADLIPDGTADSVHKVLKQNPISHQITYDQGSEFALWKMIERDTGASIYFADSHSPWQRGKNENTNGRLRRIFPKKFDFATITQQDLGVIVDLMNQTPRESLNWQIPAVLFEKMSCTSG